MISVSYPKIGTKFEYAGASIEKGVEGIDLSENGTRAPLLQRRPSLCPPVPEKGSLIRVAWYCYTAPAGAGNLSILLQWLRRNLCGM